MPGLDPGLRARHGFGVAFMRGMVEGRKLHAKIAQPCCHHIEHAAGHTLRYCLGQARHTQPTLAADLPVIRGNGTIKQAQQRRFASAIAADDADALVGFQSEIDAVEQQRAADTVVDLE